MHFSANFSPPPRFLTKNTLPNCPSPKHFSNIKSLKAMLLLGCLALETTAAGMEMMPNYRKISWFLRVTSIRLSCSKLSIFLMGRRQTFPFPYFLILDLRSISLSGLVASRIYYSLISTPGSCWSTLPSMHTTKCFSTSFFLQIISLSEHYFIYEI